VSHARAARSALVLVALAIALAIGALLGATAGPTVDADAVQAATPAPTAVQPAEPAAPALPALPGYDAADPFLVELLGAGSDVTPERAVELLLAADRVCEAMTAGVPLIEVEPVLAEELSLSDEEAHEFARLAGWVRCSPTRA